MYMPTRSNIMLFIMLHPFTSVIYIYMSCIEDATEDDVKAFIYEMELLLSIGPHPNIMPLIQICTTGSESLCCTYTTTAAL